MEERQCLYCQSAFFPNKYSRRQKVCSNPDCQKKRQLDSMKLWRQKNPNYFKYDSSKGLVWLETQRKRSKDWRANNPQKVKAYRRAHYEAYRAYMRDYMRKYRQKNKPLPSQGAPENTP
jgi:hypothetical protein